MFSGQYKLITVKIKFNFTVANQNMSMVTERTHNINLSTCEVFPECSSLDFGFTDIEKESRS